MFSDPEHNIEQFNLQPGLMVADIGAGSGFYTFAAAKAVGPEGRIYAIEIQQDLLNKLMNQERTQKLSNIEGIWGDVEKLGGTKLAEESVNAVIVANILFQVEDKQTFATEIFRILKPGGELLVIDWSESFQGMGPSVDHVITKDMAEPLFQSAKLEKVREINAGAQHYGIIFRKK